MLAPDPSRARYKVGGKEFEMSNFDDVLWAIFWVSGLFFIAGLATSNVNDTEDQRKKASSLFLVATIALLISGLALRDELTAWANDLGRSMPWNNQPND